MARVLVVDDDPDLLQLVQMQLKGQGHRVVAVSSGPAALEAVDRLGDPEVAVLDVTMPGMSGLELLVELRKRPGTEQLPAIFLTARVQPRDIEAGRALGAIYLTKPYIASALYSAIERSLRPAAQVAGGDGW